MHDLERQLNAASEGRGFAVSWWVKGMAGGRVFHRDGFAPVPSASTRKVSILMAALKAVHDGRLDLDETVTMAAAHQQGVASGILRFLTPGLVMSMRDLVVQMIITSDNVATRIIAERLGLDALNAYCRGIGLSGTVHRFAMPTLGTPADHPLEAVTTTTPADQGLLLDLIWQGTQDEAVAARLGVTAALCRWAIEVMTWQQHRNMIPSQLPYETRIASKSGRGARGRMDVGLVFKGDRPLFILAAYTDRVPETMPDGLPGYAAAFAVIGRLARLCWDGLPA